MTDFDPAIPGRNVVENPASGAVFGLLGQWHNHCLSGHSHCSPLSLCSTPELPTGVIKVGPLDQPPNPNLYIPETSCKNGRYAALSHCWGADASTISKTHIANIREMQNRIGLEPLSTNFADAIRVAHEMKLQYIWIDAFCIIQDSSEDWAKESAKMAQYYKHADFMISGLSSPHANHGLLHPRGSERNVARICTSRGEVFLRPQLYDVVSIVSDKSTSYIRPHVSYIPLNERAWTLQERVLSCHIIHFAEQQIVWQCKTCALSEDGQYTEISDRGSKGKLVDTIDLKVKHNRIHPDELVSVARTGRHDLLLEYTGRQLTYDEDKSPAISDLAREVAQIAEGKYIAGLSLRRLREGLFVAQIR